MADNKTRIFIVAIAATVLTVGFAGTTMASGGSLDVMGNLFGCLDCGDDGSSTDGNATVASEGGDGAALDAAVDAELNLDEEGDAVAQSESDHELRADASAGAQLDLNEDVAMRGQAAGHDLVGDLEGESARLTADASASLEGTQDELTSTVEGEADRLTADVNARLDETQRTATDLQAQVEGESGRLTADLDARVDETTGTMDQAQAAGVDGTVDLDGTRHTVSEDTSFVEDLIDFVTVDVSFDIFGSLDF